MKSKERHDLRRNELLEILSDPRALARRYGLTVLIVVVAAAVAIFLIFRASGAQERKWQQAWAPLDRAVGAQNEEQMRAISDKTNNEAQVRAWANIKRGELLRNRSQQNEYFFEQGAREELLNQAINCYQQALQIDKDTGKEWREVVGQAVIGMGMCYENLGQFAQAAEQYQTIISQPEDRFAETIWLRVARTRKTFLEDLKDEKIVFGP